MPSERQYQFDNAKAVLISLVVIGHIFELTVSRKTDMAYSFIYLFHMPLFVFCSGYFAKHSPKRVLQLILIYLSFQLLYSVFLIYALNYEAMAIQFTTPYWIMWYMFALIIWTSLVPIIDMLTNKKPVMFMTIFLSAVLGIIAGFDGTIGYYMSLSRILYFFPFFIAGFCVKKFLPGEKFPNFTSNRFVRIFSAAGTAAIAVLVIFNYQRINPNWLWASQSYEALAYSGYNFYVRILKYVCAAVISLFFMSMMPKNKLFFTFIGKRTLEVFLVHGFVIRLMQSFSVMYAIPGGYVTLGFILLAAAAMVLLFSSGLFTPHVWFDFLTGKQVPNETIFVFFRNCRGKFIFGGKLGVRRRAAGPKS